MPGVRVVLFGEGQDTGDSKISRKVDFGEAF